MLTTRHHKIILKNENFWPNKTPGLALGLATQAVVGSAIFAGNADLVLDRIQFATGPTCGANARRELATGSFFPVVRILRLFFPLHGDPAASTCGNVKGAKVPSG